MYKIFILAVSIAVFSFTNRSPVKQPGEAYHTLSFNYRITGLPAFFTDNSQKKGESWSPGWMASAQENIRRSEYHFNWQPALNAYCTPNRKNNLRFYYTATGFSVQPRTTRIPMGDQDPLSDPSKIEYRQIPGWKVNFDLDKEQVQHGKWQIVNNKADFISPTLTVQYINNDDGMRQNFIVEKPLSKNDELKINFTIRTKLKILLTGNQLQFRHKGKAVLNYDDLKVWDATGRKLAACFKKYRSDKYAIQVETKHAVYPITIDPLSSTPAAMLESNQAGANIGHAVAPAGDVNGDGYSDVIAGAPYFDNGTNDEGAAFVFHGSATGVSTSAAAMLESNQEQAYLGWSVSTACDVNGDGYSDVIVGAPNYDNGQPEEGAAFIYHGSATGVNTTAAAMVESNQSNALFGSSVSAAGDVNGDGYSDVLSGAFAYDNGEMDEGAVFIYHGSSSGINTTAAAMVQSNQHFANLGYSVAGAGDVNADGYSDFIAGVYGYDNGQLEEGAAFIYHGSASGINTTAAAILESNQTNALMGISVSNAGDVNGDGYSDVVAGVVFYDNGELDEGAAFIFHGSASGIIISPASIAESNQAGASMGVSVSCAGDVNGDGYSDVIAGASQYNNGQIGEGGVFVFNGSSTGINIIPVNILESNQVDANFGRAVASAGDVNGDGYSDVIAGSLLYDNGQVDEGAAFIYHGSAAGINISSNALLESNQVNANLGYSVSSAGDVNADGYSDVIVGVPFYDNTESNEGAAFIYHGSATGISLAPATIVESNQPGANLGFAVACAGDVNGDRYSDIIVGSPFHDLGQTDEGAAFIYHGSASGIIPAAATTLQSNQTGANLGYAVSGAGDVNGDGYQDVIAGAYLYDNGQTDEGAVFVYHGRASGVNPIAATLVECNQPNAFFGFSISGAGSVNADGFSDIIVGAPVYDNPEIDEGAVFVYHGSFSGINAAAAAMLQADQVDARLGFSVSGAGDVNGDGYTDVIAGAYTYDNGQADEGVAFIYHGGSGGVNTTAAALLESNQPASAFGYAVANAGDVNGDGYADVIVGAYTYDNGQTNEGVAFIYQGSATGMNTVAAALIESNQPGSALGNAVGAAGDVNADGYSDVIVGAYGYDNGSTNEGASFVHLGNSTGLNKRNNLRLYNNDLVTPINSSNFFIGNFGAGLYARSFLGKARGKMVWETRLNHDAYNGTPITNSVYFTAQQSSYTDLGLAGIELKNIITKMLAGGRYTKMRARIKYDPVTAITGQVYSPWRNVSSIIDANNLGALPIDLISFNAAWLEKGKTAKLSFTTDKEAGICCFDIEKSADGFNFYSIGIVQARNTSGIQQYSFIDRNAVDRNQFYRLKIKAPTGQFEYSNIQQLQQNTSGEILVFPNPATDVLNIRLNSDYQKMNISIINVSGQVVKQFSNNVTAGQTLSIPVTQLAAGPYWLHLQSGNERQVLQFMKK